MTTEHDNEYPYLLLTPEDWEAAKDRVNDGDGDMGEYAYQHDGGPPHTYPVLARFTCWDDPNGPYHCTWVFMDRDELAALLARFPEEAPDAD